jgi:hypothetical protein
MVRHLHIEAVPKTERVRKSGAQVKANDARGEFLVEKYRSRVNLLRDLWHLREWTAVSIGKRKHLLEGVTNEGRKRIS